MKFSVIIPARNEEAHLPQLINHIRKTSEPLSTEIIVVDGKSSDATLKIAEDLADQAIKGSLCCRATQMHEGANHASGDVLIFLHADTRLPDNWQHALKNSWRRHPHIAGTAFKVGFDNPSVYYNFISLFANARARWLTGVPHGDQAIAVKKNLYDKAGGFPDVPIMEEYFLTKRLKPFGKLKILPYRVRTSARRYEKDGPIKNNLRNLSIIGLFYLGVPPHRLAKLYR